MEALVKEKVLEQFVNTPTTSIVETQPINVDINTTNVTRMIRLGTMTTNDGNYFIRYGGFPNNGDYYNAIEVYSVNSLDNNEAVYTFANLKIDNHIFYINKMKQSEDGRFYATAQYYDGNNFHSYLIIFNNFIQDGYCQVNKFYSNDDIGISDIFFYDIAKVENTGVYFIATENRLIKFEINILEGNKTSTATIVDSESTTSGGYYPMLSVLGDDLIYTKLWVDEDEELTNHEYIYKKSVIKIDEELPSSITLKRIYYRNFSSSEYVYGALLFPYEAVIPFIYSTATDNYIGFQKINLNGEVVSRINFERSFSSNENLIAYLQGDFASVSDGSNIYLLYFDKNSPYNGLREFYTGTFSGALFNTQILQKYNLNTIVGTVGGAVQSIVSIKNIYSPNVTSESYYNYNFCIPYYMNLYSNSNDNTSLIFSRNATERFYSGNQLTASFNVPNYLLNDGNIEKASVYGQTNYLMNSQIQDFEKNRFESLYFNFIYNLNVIDNTNGLSVLNKSGSNRLANSLWNRFNKDNTRLSKARITYEDLATEIIDLNIPEVVGESVTFSYFVNGNITKIEYLSNDEKTVYATFRTNIEDRSYNLITENNEDILTEQGIELLGEEAYTITQTITIN